MAEVGEDDVYESDPEEEEKRLPGMRRREAASDDEECEDNNDSKERRMDSRSGHIHDSEESDDQGGAAEYDDDDVDELIEEDEGDEVEGYEDEGEVIVKENDGKEEQVNKEGGEGKEGEGEEKKEIEPFAVPTAGAFYMHDDRFRGNSRGRHRRLQDGRRLWESKDDKKWGHDKFEELTSQERPHEQGSRSSRGSYRGRGGRNRVPEGGYVRRSRPKPLSNGDSQNEVRKVVKGRGPRKYEGSMRNSSQISPTQKKQPGKLLEKSSHISSGKVITQASNTESDLAPPARKHSSLSSASPPFYPSGSTNKDLTLSEKRDVHAVNSNKNLRTPVIDDNLSARQSSVSTRGKNIANSVDIDKLYMNESIISAAGKQNNMPMSPGSSIVNNMQPTHPRAQGRGVAVSAQMTYRPTGNRVFSTPQIETVQRSTVQNLIQPPVQSTGQQLGPHSGSSSRASTPPKTALTMNTYEASEGESTSESSKSRNVLVAKGKGTIQGSGRGSFPYGGAQVMGATGNMGVGHGDQNFPAFLPVMQFGGQHAGGLEVPTVGMAFPGYVAQPQHGLGNSEMTWLPVLAGAAGALGATYCSPYIAVDGAYQSRASGQTSSLGSSSKESNANKASNDLKTTQRPELASNDDFGQRQKPRRYSEMDFKQPGSSS